MPGFEQESKDIWFLWLSKSLTIHIVRLNYIFIYNPNFLTGLL